MSLPVSRELCPAHPLSPSLCSVNTDVWTVTGRLLSPCCCLGTRGNCDTVTSVRATVSAGIRNIYNKIQCRQETAISLELDYCMAKHCCHHTAMYSVANYITRVSVSVTRTFSMSPNCVSTPKMLLSGPY